MFRTGLKSCQYIGRRDFLQKIGLMAASASLLPCMAYQENEDLETIRSYGPASTYIPFMKAAFIRRKGEYGIRWPGQVYDGEAALRLYTREIKDTAERLGMRIDLQAEPLYSMEETEQWLSRAVSEKPDGLLIVLLDRQDHAWPSVSKALDTSIPTVVFSPIGSSFTTNTAAPFKREGVYICSTDSFSQPAFGMKMIKAGAKLRETRFLIIKGKEAREDTLQPFGTRLRYIPADDFIQEYRRIGVDSRVKQFSLSLAEKAREIKGARMEDIQNGIKSTFVARNLLKREACDAISMDCLGALGPTDISLPCISWSWMNDHAVPAACEADLGACATLALVHYLFGRPGFQQDPVADTYNECLIGAHCSCPTRLGGFDSDQEPYSIVHHHGERDATLKPVWRRGMPVTLADLFSGDDPFGTLQTGSDRGNRSKVKMVISSGEVADNVQVPPSGGCVISVAVKLDGVRDLLDYPGFHQIFFYGDYRKELRDFCRLFRIEPVVV